MKMAARSVDLAACYGYAVRLCYCRLRLRWRRWLVGLLLRSDDHGAGCLDACERAFGVDADCDRASARSAIVYDLRQKLN